MSHNLGQTLRVCEGRQDLGPDPVHQTTKMAGINNAPARGINNVSAKGMCGGRRSIWSNSTEPTTTVLFLTVLSVDRVATTSELDEPKTASSGLKSAPAPNHHGRKTCALTLFICYNCIRLFERMTSSGKATTLPKDSRGFKATSTTARREALPLGESAEREEDKKDKEFVAC